MTASTYHPSGRVPRRGVHAILAAGPAAIFSALAYGWLMAVVPSGLKFLLAIFALLGVWIWMSALARHVAAIGNIRNPDRMGWAGAGLGLLAWYVQWAAYIVMDGIEMSGDMGVGLGWPALECIARLCLRPGAMFDWAFAIPLYGRSTLEQCAMVFFWFVEFCVHFFPPMLAGRKRAGVPFCETGDRWATEIEVEVDFEPVADPEAAQQLLEADPGQFATMLVPRSEDPVGAHMRVTLYRCAGPESFITIRHYAPIALEAVPLPPEMIGVMNAAAPNAECFWEHPIVELLRVPLADPDALLRHWSGGPDGCGSGAGDCSAILGLK